ncbi:hypothetical protein EVJ58_g6162 [Rhodofomes roseus]|uniref:Uncharacterized protein n=1 Tax=Rhodofomes roseus TaxID=34475 RepID=A0A4Y9YAT1_9APHY|nr:hypothetical protein EVJ58_g6162 [Rhodofomes roseus]
MAHVLIHDRRQTSSVSSSITAQDENPSLPFYVLCWVVGQHSHVLCRAVLAAFLHASVNRRRNVDVKLGKIGHRLVYELIGICYYLRSHRLGIQSRVLLCHVFCRFSSRDDKLAVFGGDAVVDIFHLADYVRELVN